MTDSIASTTTVAEHRRRWLARFVLCVSLLVIVIDNTIVNVALPTLVIDLRADMSQHEHPDGELLASVSTGWSES